MYKEDKDKVFSVLYTLLSGDNTHSSAMNDAYLYHFTNVNSLKEIIENRFINFSHIRHMSDLTDDMKIFDSVKSNLLNMISVEEQGYIIDIEAVFQGSNVVEFVEAIKNKFIDMYNLGVSENVLLFLAIKYYEKISRNDYSSKSVFSFSLVRQAKDDNARMWNIYGDKGQGVRIGFDVANFLNDFRGNINFEIDKWGIHDVLYFDDESLNFISICIIELCAEFMRNVKRESDKLIYSYLNIVDDIVYIGALLKPKQYLWENEVRCLLSVSSINKVNFSVVDNNQLRPFVKIKLFSMRESINDSEFIDEADYAISELIVGPACRDELLYSLNWYLDKNNIESILLRKSGVKYIER